MVRISITVDVDATTDQISEEELTDLESAVEDTLTEWGHKHEIAVATIDGKRPF